MEVVAHRGDVRIRWCCGRRGVDRSRSSLISTSAPKRRQPTCTEGMKDQVRNRSVLDVSSSIVEIYDFDGTWLIQELIRENKMPDLP